MILHTWAPKRHPIIISSNSTRSICGKSRTTLRRKRVEAERIFSINRRSVDLSNHPSNHTNSFTWIHVANCYRYQSDDEGRVGSTTGPVFLFFFSAQMDRWMGRPNFSPPPKPNELCCSRSRRMLFAARKVIPSDQASDSCREGGGWTRVQQIIEWEKIFRLISFARVVEGGRGFLFWLLL